MALILGDVLPLSLFPSFTLPLYMCQLFLLSQFWLACCAWPTRSLLALLSSFQVFNANRLFTLPKVTPVVVSNGTSLLLNSLQCIKEKWISPRNFNDVFHRLSIYWLFYILTCVLLHQGTSCDDSLAKQTHLPTVIDVRNFRFRTWSASKTFYILPESC